MQIPAHFFVPVRRFPYLDRSVVSCSTLTVIAPDPVRFQARLARSEIAKSVTSFLKTALVAVPRTAEKNGRKLNEKPVLLS